MQTDRLIDTLARDVDHRQRPVGVTLAIALLLAAPVSMALFMATLGVRDDVMTAMHNPFFDLKFVVTLTLAIAAIAVSVHLARPETSLRGWGWLLVVPLALVGVGIAAEWMLPQQRPWLVRMIGNNAPTCVVAIPAFSIPLLVAALLALRRGAPARPALAGAMAGVLAAGLGATLYASHCADDSPLFVALWYSIAVAFVAGVGAIAGHRMLRY